MKNLKFIWLIVMAFSLTHCNYFTKDNGNNKQVQLKNDSLQRLVIQKDSAIYAFLNTFNEIEGNLQTIKDKEKIISATATDVELGQSREEKINEDIQIIYNLMQENQDKVASLRTQLKRAQVKGAELQTTIANLQAKLAEKNAQILQLRRDLLDMNLKVDELSYTIDTLLFENEVKNAIIEAQEESLNTAYYLYGTKKELKQNNVLDKKGGFIGIGGAKELNEDFDKEYFTKIDVRETKGISLNTKKAEIITTHPTGSYTFTGTENVDSLIIENPDEFWKVSKFLVIVVN